ncbi:TPA: hypothetical protein RJD49_002468 [Legionella pneumophila]|nr:hypothetical protein [Legionella pneumophila]HDV5806609.1 hypothetical protein [Legionella pneumophila]
MDLFHIKIFKKPKQVLSVVYSIQTNPYDSHFIPVERCHSFLYRPGVNPEWIDEAILIQDVDLNEARIYVFNKIYEESKQHSVSIKLGWEWGNSQYQNDSFVNALLELTGHCEYEVEDD